MTDVESKRIYTLIRGEATADDLREALDRLDVGDGDPFVICSQATLFDRAGGDRPPSNATATSRAAGLANYPRSGGQRWRVLLAIARAGADGLTRDEIGRGLELPYGSVGARVNELIYDAGFCEPNGETRSTEFNTQAEVVVLTQRGRAAVGENDPGDLAGGELILDFTGGADGGPT